ncbi:MAG TPA: response regulator transcription factor [Symbiobacteriaceae bacterium]
MRILIADDHRVLRTGLRMLLQAQPGIEVVGEASNGEEAITRAVELHPDLVLLDLNMPGCGGACALHQIRERCPQTKVLVLTMHDDVTYVRAAFKAGAAGYVLKEAADQELLAAIDTVAQGQTYVYPTLAGRVLGLDPIASDADKSVLSPRETEVLKLISLGYTNQEIADQLLMGVRTVETHKTHIMEKLGITTRAQMVRYALQHGLVKA